jgi:hypothetical protein
MGPYTSIQVDREVFEFLQRHATPLVDTPNDVLRRLLLANAGESPQEESPMSATASAPSPVDAESFVNHVLRTEFGAGFRRRPPYRLMFESEDALVYFQNFNKESDHLWYRVTEQPWKELSSSGKAAWLCLTNPAERFVYVLPVKDIQTRIEGARWSRPYLEVNVDPSSSRWSELDWRLDDYRKQF